MPGGPSLTCMSGIFLPGNIPASPGLTPTPTILFGSFLLTEGDVGIGRIGIELGSVVYTIGFLLLEGTP